MVGLVVTAFGTLIVAWWGFSFSLGVATQLLILHGRPKAARRIGAFAPAFMRRAACLVLGMNLVAAPAANAADSAFAVPPTPQQAQAAEAPAYTPQWTTVPEPQLLAPSWRPKALPAEGGPLVKQSRPPLSEDLKEVVVLPGDSLWSITSRYLGPDVSDLTVAAAWPQWYAANRETIGHNPHLLRPGQILHPPTPAESK